MMIKYLRKPGKIIGYEIESNDETGELELIPIFAKGGHPMDVFMLKRFVMKLECIVFLQVGVCVVRKILFLRMKLFLLHQKEQEKNMNQLW